MKNLTKQNFTESSAHFKSRNCGYEFAAVEIRECYASGKINKEECNKLLQLAKKIWS
jgi:hypothetical protein